MASSLLSASERFARALAEKEEAETLSPQLALLSESTARSLEAFLADFAAAGGRAADLQVRGDRLSLRGVDTDQLKARAALQQACEGAPLPEGLLLLAVHNNYKNEFLEHRQEGSNEVSIDGEVLLGFASPSTGSGACRIVAVGRSVVDVRSIGSVRSVKQFGTRLSIDDEVLLSNFDEPTVYWSLDDHAAQGDVAKAAEAAAKRLNSGLGRPVFDEKDAGTLLKWLTRFFAPHPLPYSG